MCISCQDISHVSPEYREFIDEYHKFLKYSMQVSLINVAIITLKEQGIQALTLLTQAVEAQLAATNAYMRLVALYEQLVQKYWDSTHR
jgi:hypothetical protein